MPSTYTRTIRLADTDAAGVVYFARTLSLCHEAYEEALHSAGVALADLLGGHGIIVPISKSEAEYLRPLRAGEKVRITLTPRSVSDDTFAIQYEIHRVGPPDKLAARVRTEHVCTSTTQRGRASLPAKLAAWIKAG